MRRGLVGAGLAVALGAASAGCPGVAGLEVRVTAPQADTPHFVVEARTTLRALLRLAEGAPPPRGLSGRAQLGVRAPRGWTISGRYRLDDRAHPLFVAPLVAEAYAQEAPAPGGARWHGFVSFLHTDVAPDAPIELTLALAPPPGAARVPAEVAVGAGPAPNYPRFRAHLARSRTLRLAW